VRLNRWNNFPVGIKQHLQQRLLDRKITVDDLEKLLFPIFPQAIGSGILDLSKLQAKARIHSLF